MKKFSIGKLNYLKNQARKLGNLTIGGYAETIARFFMDNNIWQMDTTGQQWEIAAFFVIGVFQASMKERRIRFFVNTDKDLDRVQIDLEINQHPIQLKIGWGDAAIAAVQDELAFRNIIVVNAPSGGYGSDIFSEILAAAGFLEKEIEAEVDENPGFDAAEEVFEWFKQGVEF